jgi:hypothetical protein
VYLWNELRVSPQRLTVDRVDVFIADLKDSVREAKVLPSGKGTMVAVYGTDLLPSFHCFVLFIFFIVQVWETQALLARPWWDSWRRRFWIRCTRRNGCVVVGQY